MNIFYIHGFRSSFQPESNKMKGLEKLGSVYGVNVDYESPTFLHELKATITNHSPPIDLLVGTSMGGWSCMVLGPHFGIPFIAYNPAVEPQKTLKRHKDLSSEFAERFSSPPAGGAGMIVVSEDDDIIDPQMTLDLYSDKYFTVKVNGEGHRFQNLMEVKPEIDQFLTFVPQIYGNEDI